MGRGSTSERMEFNILNKLQIYQEYKFVYKNILKVMKFYCRYLAHEYLSSASFPLVQIVYSFILTDL